MNYEIIKQHASGKAIMMKKPIRGLLMIKPALLLAYQNDNGLRSTDFNYVCSRPILAIPVHRSPLLTRHHWTPKYTNSLSTLIMLRTIQMCYMYNPCKGLEERTKQAYDTFKQEIDALENTLFDNDLATFYKHNPTPTQENCTQLLHRLEKHTVDTINVFERCIHAMFIPEVPVQHVLTPFIAPDLSELDTDEQQHVLKNTEKLFVTKERIQNERLEYFGQEKQYYFKPITTENPKFNNYLDQQRVIEYFAFLNINKGNDE